jgi:signal transduction histidine kinase
MTGWRESSRTGLKWVRGDVMKHPVMQVVLRWQYWLQVLVLAVVYAVAAWTGFKLAPAYAHVTSIWFPAGIGLAALLILGIKMWPGTLLGPILFTQALGVPWLPSLLGGVGDMLSSLVGALALRHLCHLDDRMATFRDAISMIVFGAVLPTLFGGAIGTTSLYISGIIPLSTFGEVFKVWWLADMAGALTLAPFLLSLVNRPKSGMSRSHRLEGVALLGLLVLTCWLVFGRGFQVFLGNLLPSYVVLPFVVWAALRFDIRMTSSVVMLSSISAIGGTLKHLVTANVAHSIQILYLQIFMSSMSAIGLLLSAATQQQRNIAQALRDDVERRKVLEAQLNLSLIKEREARIEAEKSVQVRDDFLAIASHELRTPITPIKMYLQLLMRHMQGISPDVLPRIRSLLSGIESADRQLERLSRLIDDLLDVSRITAGRLILNREEFDLSELVGDLVERFRPVSLIAKCDLKLSAQPQVTGFWDRSRIEQVAANLLTNAMKYGAGNPIEITVASEDNVAKLVVRDHGIGIAEEDQGKIFERFERVAPVKHYGGLGLGLYITREIVSAHGGTIQVESGLGQGCRFTVEFPLGGLG